MNKKLWIALLVGFCLSLMPLVVQAGGWSIVTLERLPTELVANQATTIRFRVLAHGAEAHLGLTPTVKAIHQESKELFTTEAVFDEGEFYKAELMLPADGVWTWSIYPYGINHYDFEMPSLTVQAAPPAQVAQMEMGASTSPFLMLLTLPLVAVLTFIFSRGWPSSLGRWAVAAVCLVGILGVSFWAMATPSAAQTGAPAAEVSDISQAELGAQLFVAKGCRQCHVNIRAEGESLYNGIAPNLTEYVGNPEYLSLWLADPQSLKPNTLMPNLDLRDDEIDALIAFLTETEPAGS